MKLSHSLPLLPALLCAATLLATPPTGNSQNTTPPPSSLVEGCCGPITPAGQNLLKLLDSMDVEHHWLLQRHVDWQTGEATSPVLDTLKTSTHCSTFAAAVGNRLGIYMLRPPDHSQKFLASAQGEWFVTPAARDQGWTQVLTARDAQRLANEGNLVVLDFINPNPDHPGHIAVVRPALKSTAALAADGPETIQAGKTNFADGTASRSFASHQGAWPAHVTIWFHPTHIQN